MTAKRRDTTWSESEPADRGDVLSTAAEETIERPPWYIIHIRYTLIGALSYTVGLGVIVWYIEWWKCERSHCLHRMWKEGPLLVITLGTLVGIYLCFRETFTLHCTRHKPRTKTLTRTISKTSYHCQPEAAYPGKIPDCCVEVLFVAQYTV